MSELLATLWRDETPYLLATVFVLAVVLYRWLAAGRKTLKHSLLLFGLWLLLDALAALFAARGAAEVARGLHLSLIHI